MFLGRFEWINDGEAVGAAGSADRFSAAQDRWAAVVGLFILVLMQMMVIFMLMQIDIDIEL